MTNRLIGEPAFTDLQKNELLSVLKKRFESNSHRHPTLSWAIIQSRLEERPDKLWALSLMESTEGEPDVVMFEQHPNELMFVDCSTESPRGRRSLCYDQEALDSRKENKPQSSALAMASMMGVDILTEDQYRQLQKLGEFDIKTSSWIKTPEAIRKLKGALFCDRRYNTVFVYHNGAESYYASRGFRACLKL